MGTKIPSSILVPGLLAMIIKNSISETDCIGF